MGMYRTCGTVPRRKAVDARCGFFFQRRFTKNIEPRDAPTLAKDDPLALAITTTDQNPQDATSQVSNQETKADAA
jgi:hypothetical protein